MDEVRIGLDFGTHQTKVCVQITPDEGHGEPYYEFFKFKDLDGNDTFFLPSTIQINKDMTLSYGYVDKSARLEQDVKRPILDTTYTNAENEDIDIDKAALYLYSKYTVEKNIYEEEQDIAALKKMLNQLVDKVAMKKKLEALSAKERYEQQMRIYLKNANVFRYFKQATFSVREWNMKIPAVTLSIWYLTYVIFLLEEKYGTNFSINLGIPTDKDAYEKKKELAVEIMLTAYHLVEDVYNNDINKFLAEKLDDLLMITNRGYQSFSQERKDFYFLNIFPEAYAGLISLTSKGRLATGMSLTADIGGGTTDISFFTIRDRRPVIYRYWSIPYGLNYIAERSGFDYQDEDLSQNANSSVIDGFNERKQRGVSNLISDLVRQFTKEETSVPIDNLYAALRDRVVVYNGGGSAFPFLTTALSTFTDVKIINSGLWKEENILNKDEVKKYCQLLSTSYGLSLSEQDSDVQVEPFTSLFESFPKRKSTGRVAIDKDMV